MRRKDIIGISSHIKTLRQWGTWICVAVSAIVVIISITCMYEVASSKYVQIATMLSNMEQGESAGTVSSLPITAEVEQYRGQVLAEAQIYDREEYIDLFLAVMMQESGGRGEDVFQASESLGLHRNSLTLAQSIAQGVKVLSQRLDAAGVISPLDIMNIRLALQGYNFGGGYINWALTRDGCWTQDNVNSYAERYSNGVQRTGISAERMGIWAYGDQYYTDHVLRYYSYCTISGDFSNIVEEAQKHLGKPYEWGATGPNSFDCSGFVYYVYRVTGKYTGARMTAAGYKNAATEITEEEAQPGDLVFFTNGSGTHHVGIYIGNGKMIHAPQPGDVIKESSIYRTNGDVISFGRLE